MPKRVLQQLGELGFLETGHGNRTVDQGREERVDVFERRLVDTRHDLRGVSEGPFGIARVDALRAVADREIFSGTETGGCLQAGYHDLLCRSWIRRGLE